MNCDRTDCIHYKVCEEWKSLGNDNYINDSYGNCDNYAPAVEKRPQDELISRGDALKAVDARHEELLHDTKYRNKPCQIDLLGIKKHILAIPPVAVSCKECDGYEAGYSAGLNDAERLQGKWFENITKGLLKSRHGDYVLYKVDYLLDNLAREVNIMESARRMEDDAKPKKEVIEKVGECKCNTCKHKGTWACNNCHCFDKYEKR